MVKICFDDDCEKIDDCLHCQKNALIICFLINLAMFALELFYGLRENSASLLGDAAHNSGDALILGSSLFVMASTLRVKAKLALIKSFIMLGFGLLTFYYVCLILYAGTVPHAETLTAVGAFALIGNIISALLLMYYRNKDINLKSAYICCRNDVLASAGIIVAGILVMYTASFWPDVIIGSLIGGLIVWSSIGIAKESLGVIVDENFKQ